MKNRWAVLSSVQLFSSDADIVRLTNARIIIIIIVQEASPGGCQQTMVEKIVENVSFEPAVK